MATPSAVSEAPSSTDSATDLVCAWRFLLTATDATVSASKGYPRKQIAAVKRRVSHLCGERGGTIYTGSSSCLGRRRPRAVSCALVGKKPRPPCAYTSMRSSLLWRTAAPRTFQPFAVQSGSWKPCTVFTPGWGHCSQRGLGTPAAQKQPSNSYLPLSQKDTTPAEGAQQRGREVSTPQKPRRRGLNPGTVQRFLCFKPLFLGRQLQGLEATGAKTAGVQGPPWLPFSPQSSYREHSDPYLPPKRPAPLPFRGGGCQCPASRSARNVFLPGGQWRPRFL